MKISGAEGVAPVLAFFLSLIPTILALPPFLQPLRRLEQDAYSSYNPDTGGDYGHYTYGGSGPEPTVSSSTAPSITLSIVNTPSLSTTSSAVILFTSENSPVTATLPGSSSLVLTGMFLIAKFRNFC